MTLCVSDRQVHEIMNVLGLRGKYVHDCPPTGRSEGWLVSNGVGIEEGGVRGTHGCLIPTQPRSRLLMP